MNWLPWRVSERRDTEQLARPAVFNVTDAGDQEAPATFSSAEIENVVRRVFQPIKEELHNLQLRLRQMELERDYPDPAAVHARIQELLLVMAGEDTEGLTVKSIGSGPRFIDADGAVQNAEFELKELLRFARKKGHL